MSLSVAPELEQKICGFYIYEMPSGLKFSHVEIELITLSPQYAASHELPILVRATTYIFSSIKKNRGKVR